MGHESLTGDRMAERRQWLILAYRLPREPSTPRIAVWRKLRQIGATQIVDGVVALPQDNRTREQFEWLAERVREFDGEAWLWINATMTAAQERDLIRAMSSSIAEEYAVLRRQAREAQRGPQPIPRRTVTRLRRALRDIAARDYFGASEQRSIRAEIERLATKSEEARR